MAKGDMLIDDLLEKCRAVEMFVEVGSKEEVEKAQKEFVEARRFLDLYIENLEKTSSDYLKYLKEAGVFKKA